MDLAGALLVQDLVEVEEFVREHCPRGELRGVERSVGLRFAGCDQLGRIVAMLLVEIEQLAERCFGQLGLVGAQGACQEPLGQELEAANKRNLPTVIEIRADAPFLKN